jgi:tetratricopeptide (TPR) repeat protein
MTNNLSSFNKTFSDNTKNLGDTFSKVNNSYKNHVSLIHAIDNLKITDIATANISVYEKLKNSTDEIGVFAEYLEKTNEYLTIIQNLSQNLGDYERRTRILEDAGAFFKKNENWLADNIDSANLKVETAVQRFDENTEHYLSNLRDSLNQQILKFDEVINEQQTRLKSSLEASSEIVALSLSKNQELFEKAIALQQESFEKAINYQQKTFESKLEETSTLVNEIKSISHIKEGVKAFEKETKKQSDKIDALTKEIRNLANSNSSRIWSPTKSNNGGNKTNGGHKEKETWGQKLKKGLKRPFSKRKK